MRTLLKVEIAELLLVAMLALVPGYAVSDTFKSSDANVAPCTGELLIEPSGVVKCGPGGTTLLSSCAADVVIDSSGIVRCSSTSVAGVPVCTLTATPSAITAGSASTLTATCAPAATSYLWTGMTPTTASVVVSPTMSTTYSVKGKNAAGTGSSANVLVTVNSAATSTQPTAVPTCLLTNSSGSFVQGKTDTLTATCNQGPTSYAWSDATCSPSSASCPVAPTVTTTYSVTASNSLGAGNTASTTVVKTAVCTLTATPSALGAGESATLNASCNPAATAYTWTNTPPGFTTATASGTVTPAVTTTYTLVGTTSTGDSAPVNVTVTVATPTCTVTAAPAMVDLGASSTLTASCTPAASSYAWTPSADLTTAGGATATVLPTTAGIHTYSVTGTNGSGAGNLASATVTVAVPSCTLTATPASITAGASSTLTASCSPAATSWSWSDGGCNSASPSCSVAPAATAGYTVTGSNAAGAGLPASATVTVTQPGSTPAGCTVVDVTWPMGLSLLPGGTPTQIMNTGQMYAFRVSNMPARSSMQSGVYYSQHPTQISISQNPCEWTDAQLAAGCATQGSDPLLWNNSVGDQGTCSLAAGGTYYFNVKNTIYWNGPDSCPAGTTCSYKFAW